MLCLLCVLGIMAVDLRVTNSWPGEIAVEVMILERYIYIPHIWPWEGAFVVFVLPRGFSCV